MAAIGWGALFVACFCIFSLGFAARDTTAVAVWVLLILAVSASMVALWAFGVLDRRKTPRPVSPSFERGQALSTLDRRDGVGDRLAWMEASRGFERNDQ